MLVKLTHPLDLPKQIADAINRASHKSIFVWEKASDPRPRVTRPAPAGHATTARWSRDHRPMVADYLPKLFSILIFLKGIFLYFSRS